MMQRKPRSVQKAAKEAMELQEQLNQDPAEIAALEEEAQIKAKTEQDLKEKTEEKTPELTPTDTTLDAGAEPQKDKVVDWEGRFKGLQRRYDRDVQNLRGELDNAYSSIDELKGEINGIKENIQATPEPQVPVLDLTEEEKEQYGEGWLNVMQKVAGQSNTELAKQIVDLQQTIAELKVGQKKIHEEVVVNSEKEFFTELSRQVPDWKQVNQDEGFHEFLAEMVPYTGEERQFYLQKAREEFNVDAAVAIFNEYKSTVSKGTSTHQPDEQKVPEELVELKTTPTGTAPVEKTERVFTTAEVDQFYKDRRTGKYKGKEDEARNIELEILAAGSRGNIVSQRRYAT